MILALASQAAKQAAQWESAALLIGMAVLVTAIGAGAAQVIKAVRHSRDSIRAEMRSEVRKANGAPVKFFESCPLPAWFKDAEYRMTMLNSAYSAVFGIIDQDYIGKTDYEVWPREIADLFRRHDQEVIARRVQITVTEDVPAAPRPGSPVYQWRVIKFPVIDQISNVVLGVGGYAYPLNHPDYVAEGIKSIGGGGGATTPEDA